MKALLDTDILSELFRAKNISVQQRAADYRREHRVLTISVITEVEISRGWHRKAQPARAQAFQLWLATAEALTLDSETSWLVRSPATWSGPAKRLASPTSASLPPRSAMASSSSQATPRITRASAPPDSLSSSTTGESPLPAARSVERSQ